MRKCLLIPICFVALLVPVAVLAGSGDGGFDGIVRTIETKYHVKATRIPFMGLASFIANRASSNGVSHLHLAEFDNFSASLDGDELNRMVQQKLGPEWERMVRETSKYGAEHTLVYAHPEGNRVSLFVLDADGSELDVVQLSVAPEHLNDKIGSYSHHDHRDAQRESNQNRSIRTSPIKSRPAAGI